VEEIWAVVKELPLDKASGHDGFIGRFYRSAWSIIKRDGIRAFDALSSMDCRSFHHLNDALLILWATIALLASSTALGKNFPKL
jgi:hypothetical protein